MAFQQFADQIWRSLKLADIKNSHDVRMIQRADHASFLLEATKAIGILREGFGQDFYRDIAGKARIFAAINKAHAAGTKLALDFVRPEFCSRSKGHVV